MRWSAGLLGLFARAQPSGLSTLGSAVERRWAGLRSFAPDRMPVYGFAPEAEGFFWFAGQGGFGIQTAPAAARLGAQLLLEMAADAMTTGIDPAAYAPSRFVAALQSA
jgi:D-arginine dehydrogenase